MNPQKYSLRIAFILSFIFTSINWASAQDIPPNYELLKTIKHPKELKLGAIYEIYIDSTLNIIAISYHGKVLNIYIYNLTNWESIGHLAMKFAMLDLSFTEYSNRDIYFYENKKSYTTFNLSTKVVTTYQLTKTDSLPNQFYNKQYIEPKQNYDKKDLVITYKEWYIIKNIPTQGEIYLKR